LGGAAGPAKIKAAGSGEGAKGRVPTYESASRLEEVRGAVLKMIEWGTFSPPELRRYCMRAVAAKIAAERGEEVAQRVKPSAASSEEMYYYNKWFFRHGHKSVPVGVSPLKKEAVLEWHRKVCTSCTSEGMCELAHSLHGLITCGWDPVFDPEVDAQHEVHARARVEGNYPKVKTFGKAVEKSLGKLLDCGSATPLPVERTGTFETEHNIYVKVDALVGPDGTILEEEFIGICTPMNAIFKASDIAAARVLTKDGDVTYGLWLSRRENWGKDVEHYIACYSERPGVNVMKGEEHLEKANEQLRARGLPEIKVRLSTDCSITGVNDRARTPQFTMTSPFDATRLIKRGCWLAKGDLDNFFPQFPLAQRAWPFFVVHLAAIFYILRCCCFGFSSCPYYCSFWSAEYRRWLVVACGLSVAHFVDDFLTSGATKEEAEANLAIMVQVAEEVGLKMPPAKREVGQRMVFLGLLFDTIKMVIAIDKIKARALALTLKEHLACFEANDYTTRATDIHTVAGRLNFMSEVAQEGRLHTQVWWRYLKFGRKLWPALRERLKSDTRWWIQQLEKWADERVSGSEYPIYNSSELLAQPNRLILLQSDASGLDTDGFGYFTSGFSEEELAMSGHWYAQGWDGSYQFGDKSHVGEFMPLLHYMREADTSSCLLVWVTDCQAAFWSLNKGSCKDEVAFEVLREILQLADQKGKQIVSIWVPRERNEFADYLSHINRIFNTPHARGTIREGDRLTTTTQSVQGRSTA